MWPRIIPLIFFFYMYIMKAAGSIDCFWCFYAIHMNILFSLITRMKRMRALLQALTMEPSNLLQQSKRFLLGDSLSNQCPPSINFCASHILISAHCGTATRQAHTLYISYCVDSVYMFSFCVQNSLITIVLDFSQQVISQCTYRTTCMYVYLYTLYYCCKL